MNKDPEMHAVLIVLLWRLLQPSIEILLELLLLSQRLLLEFRHVFHKAFLEYDWLKILQAPEGLLCLKFP